MQPAPPARPERPAPQPLAPSVTSPVLVTGSEHRQRDRAARVPGGQQPQPCAHRGFGLGVAAGVGLLLVTAGAPGRRTVTPHARLALRTPGAGPVGAAVLGEQKQQVLAAIAARSGQRIDRVAADTAAQRWFDAAEAVEYGLVDAVG